MDLGERQGKILKILAVEGENSSSDVFELLKEGGVDVSLVTVKRDLSKLLDAGFLQKHGKGRATTYSLSLYGRFFIPIDAHQYCSVPPDRRIEDVGYKFKVFEEVDFSLFTEEEIEQLNEASHKYRNRSAEVSSTIHKKETQRFIIEFSWKSSQIEGNTYSLLDTEKLIEDGVPAEGHTEEEAKMILNHKKAIRFVFDQRNRFGGEINRALINEVHKRLVGGLGINSGLRKYPVGITGTAYRPLDNEHQVKKAMAVFCDAVNRTSNPYDKALLILLGISYIQPFEDGNKRTARLVANAVLLANGLAPLSYRSVEENEYKEAIIVFYELQSIVPMKKIFVKQYLFSAENYSIE